MPPTTRPTTAATKTCSTPATPAQFIDGDCDRLDAMIDASSRAATGRRSSRSSISTAHRLPDHEPLRRQRRPEARQQLAGRGRRTVPRRPTGADGAVAALLVGCRAHPRGAGTPAIRPTRWALRNTLDGHPEYRMRFADRLQKHFFNGGALTPAARQGPLDGVRRRPRPAIIAEAARWGDHRRRPPTPANDDWLTEQDRLCNSYFPVRSANVLDDYDAASSRPPTPRSSRSTAARSTAARSRAGAPDLTATAGTIYYTTRRQRSASRRRRHQSVRAPHRLRVEPDFLHRPRGIGLEIPG